MKRASISVIDMGLLFPRGTSGIRTIREKFTRFFSRKSQNQDFIALKDVNFEVLEGEVVGIIGRNGAGKSTLLRVIAGIYQPDEGIVKVRGKVSLLASVGVGFNRELTGRENVHLYGSILGLARGKIEEKMDEIISFSQLEEFIDSPIKTYSSGMRARLGFSVAANLDANILLIDEVFGVGDTTFRERSKSKIFEMVRESGRTVVIVTHNTGILTQLCDRVLLVDDGRIVASGLPDEMIEAYQRIINDGKGPSRARRNNDSVIGPASIQRASRLINRKQYAEAKVLLEANLQNNKSSEAARYFLGQLAYEMDDPAGACQYWDTLDIERIDNESRLRRIGTVSRKIGNLSLAFKTAKFALREDSDRNWAWQVIEACIRDFDHQNLVRGLPTEIPKVFNENVKKCVTLAKLAFNLKQFQTSAILSKAINTSTNRTDLIDLEGRAWHRLKDHSEALRCWERLVELEYDKTRNLDRAARSAFNLGEYSKCYKYSIRLHKNNPIKNENLVLAARAVTRSRNQLDREELVDIINNSKSGSRDARLNLVKANMELEEWETTQAMLSSALNENPDDVEFNLLSGRILMRTGNISESVENFRKSLEIEPDRTDIPIFLARALRQNGRTIEAIETLDKLLEKHPNNMNALPLVANMSSSIEDWNTCLLTWERIKQIDPDRPDSNFKIANCYLKLNRLEDAEEVLKDSMRGDSDNFTGLTLLRQIYFKQARHEDVLEIFKRLVAQEPSRIDLWAKVISLSVRLARNDEAEAYLKRVERHFRKEKYGSLQLSLLYESFQMETKMRSYLDEFVGDAQGDAELLYDAASDFLNADRADIAFVLADAAARASSQHRKSGLMMTKIYSILHQAGYNEGWLLEQYEARNPVSATELAIIALLNSASKSEDVQSPLDSVAFVVHSVGIGGAERQVINTINGFEEYLSPLPKLSLYCTNWDDKDDKDSYRRFLDESKINLKTIVGSPKEMSEAEEELISTTGTGILEVIPKNICKEILGLFIQFKKEKPQVVHAWHDRLNLVAGIAGVLAGVPRIVLSTRSVSKHDYVGISHFKRPKWYKKIYQRLLDMPQVQVYHVSKAASDSYDSWLSLQERQKLVLYNSTNYEGMRKSASVQYFNRERIGKSIPEDANIVGGIMRFSSEKRPMLFIETAALTIEKNPKIHFVMLGDGSMMDQCKRLVRRLNIEQNVHFIGRSHQVYLWLEKFDILMLTSEFEGLPNVLIECQGFGVPVVSTDAGGANETFIDGTTGVLVKNDTPEALSEAVLKCIGNDEWLKTAAVAARENARNLFSIKSATEKFVDLYSSIDINSDMPKYENVLPKHDSEAPVNLYVYVDDRNGKAGLLTAAARNRGIPAHMVRHATQITNSSNSLLYFFIDHLKYRDRDKERAEEFAKLENIVMAPTIDELRLYDDKVSQQLEYQEVMPPALYSTNPKEAKKFARETEYPFVSKALEGAGSSNVRLVRNQAQALKEIETIFSDSGRGRHDKHSPGLKQQGYVLWQKFLPDNPNDWRLIMLGAKYAMIVRRQNRPDLPFASGSGLITPENDLNNQISSMLDWGREFAINKGLRVLAGDVILDENGDFVLVETSTTWPVMLHQENFIFVYKEDNWEKSEYDGTMIFDLKADMAIRGEFNEVI